METDTRAVEPVAPSDSCATPEGGNTRAPEPVQSPAEPEPDPQTRGLPWGLVAAISAGAFLHSHRDQLAQDGAFIIVIAAVVLGVLSANMLGRK